MTTRSDTDNRPSAAHDCASGVALDDWADWLGLTQTPPVRPGTDPFRRLHIDDGIITDPQTWPADTASRIYVAYDDHGPVYVGQTTRPLLARFRSHFGHQRTPPQQHKAGTWRFVVAAVFDNLESGSLDRCERSAADWLLQLGHRRGRRHPRSDVPP